MAKDVDLNFRLIGKDVSASKALENVGKNAGRAGSKMATFGKVAAAGIALMATAALAAAAAIAKFATDAFEKFGEVAGQTLKLQRVMGGTAEDASRMASAFQMTGVDSEAAGKGIGLLSKFLVNANGQVETFRQKNMALHAAGKKTHATLGANASVLADLGIRFRDANGHILPMTKLLPDIAEKFKKMPAGAEKTALALKLFGRGGAAMLPFLNKGAKGIEELQKQSDALGTTLSGSDLAAVKANTIAKREWGHALEGIQITVGRYLYPILTKLTQFMIATLIPGIKMVSAWLVEKLGPAFTAISAWITTNLIPAITRMAAIFMQNVWPALVTVATIVRDQLAPVIASLAVYWNEHLWPAIQRSIPYFQKVAIVIGVVVAAVVVVVAWILGKLVPALLALSGKFADVASAAGVAVSWIVDNFGSIVKFVTGLPAKIATAASGMWDGIKTSFRAAINWIIDKWNDFSLTIGGNEFLGKTMPSVTLDTPNIPHLAKGGIVSRPTLALIGEAGPEAVVPLSGRNGGMGATVNVYVQGDTDPNGAARRIAALLDAGIASGSIRPNRLVTR